MAWESKVILLRVLDLETLVNRSLATSRSTQRAQKTSHKDLPHPGHETYLGWGIPPKIYN